MSKLIRSVQSNRHGFNLILGTGVYLSILSMRVREGIAVTPTWLFSTAWQRLHRRLVMA